MGTEEAKPVRVSPLCFGFRYRLQADSLGRTNSCTCATLDALVSINYIDVTGRNSLNRTLIDASTACDTRI